jgi:hypothetical protein
MHLVDEQIRANRSLYWAGIIQLFYGLFEMVDVVTITIITIGLIPNIYSSLVPVTTEIGTFMATMPGLFVIIFLFFASLRISSGYWILRNRVMGFWMAIFVTGVSLVAVWFFLPFGAFDLCIILPFIVLLFNGYYQDKPIISN